MLGRPSGPRRGGPDDLHLQARAGRRDAGRAAVGPDAVPNWRVGDTIPLGRERAPRVIGIVVSNEDEPSVLIVEDLR
jgi:hypothetical protein